MNKIDNNDVLFLINVGKQDHYIYIFCEWKNLVANLIIHEKNRITPIAKSYCSMDMDMFEVE